MSSQVSQPTILVKKTDGTSVRMSMDAFRAYRDGMKRAKDAAQHNNTKEKSLKPGDVVQWKETQETHETPKDIPVSKKTEVFSASPRRTITAPAPRPLAIPAAQAKQSDVSVGSRDHDGRVDTMLGMIRLPLSESARMRLRSLLVSLVKGIRTAQQAQEYLIRNEESGGMGMKSEDAAIAMEAIQKGMGGKNTLVEKIQRSRNAATQTPPPRPAHAPKNTETPPRPAATMRRQAMNEPAPVRAGMQRHAMHDVAPVPKERSVVGPIDELRALGVADFRRLGRNPSQCAERLRAKFEEMKKESYVMYLAGKEAWAVCPLYREYQRAAVEAMRSGQTIPDVLARGKGMTFEEFQSIVGMNRAI